MDDYKRITIIYTGIEDGKPVTRETALEGEDVEHVRDVLFDEGSALSAFNELCDEPDTQRLKVLSQILDCIGDPDGCS